MDRCWHSNGENLLECRSHIGISGKRYLFQPWPIVHVTIGPSFSISNAITMPESDPCSVYYMYAPQRRPSEALLRTLSTDHTLSGERDDACRKNHRYVGCLNTRVPRFERRRQERQKRYAAGTYGHAQQIKNLALEKKLFALIEVSCCQANASARTRDAFFVGFYRSLPYTPDHCGQLRASMCAARS